MRGFFKWFGLVAFGVVVIAVSLYTASRLMPIPAEDARALALVEAPRPLAGRNGFAALWSLKHNVPVAEAERLLAREVVRFRSLPAWSNGDALPVHASALDAYPTIDAGDGGDALCGYQEERCLRHVRGRMDALARVMAARTALDARVAALDDYDYFRSPFPPRLDMPLPSYQPLLQTQTAHAYAFALGDHDTGLRGVCGSASIARKLVASGDNLIGGVIGVALMDMSARLFVEMLAELPADYPLPDACGGAFEADGAMVAGICPTMIGEGKYIAGGLHALNGDEQPWHRELKADLFLDLRKTMAKGARRHAWFCSPQAGAFLHADTPLGMHEPVSGGWTFSCLANAAGCILDNVSAPSLAGYAERFQDTEARLRVVAAWRWLHGGGDDARPWEARIAAWQSRAPTGREVRVNATRDGLEIDLFDARQGAVFALPLPAGMTEAQAR